MDTTLRPTGPPERDRSLVPDRFDLIGEWITCQDQALELYADLAWGDGCLLHVPHRAPAKNIGSLYHAGGVLRGVVWCGFACRQPLSWRRIQRVRIAAALAAVNVEGAP